MAWDGRPWHTGKHPFDLRMQTSIGGQYSLYTPYGDCYGGHQPDFQWQRNLAELLADEKSLWGDLVFCSGCTKYRPESAFSRFDYESEIYLKHKTELDTLEAEDVDWYMGQCKKCRTKILLGLVEKRETVLEDVGLMEEKQSLGLRIPQGEESLDNELLTIGVKMSGGEKRSVFIEYESWERVFSRLAID